MPENRPLNLSLAALASSGGQYTVYGSSSDLSVPSTPALLSLSTSTAL